MTGSPATLTRRRCPSRHQHSRCDHLKNTCAVLVRGMVLGKAVTFTPVSLPCFPLALV